MLNMKRSQAKTQTKSRFMNQFKNSKKLLQTMENNVVFENIERYNRLMMSVLEPDDIILVCRNALRYLLLGVILLCLFASL